MPTLPAAVKVGFKTYQITPWPLTSVVQDDSVGCCDNFNGIIHVATESRSDFDIVETLLHEVLHACWYVSRLEQGDSEERIVSTTATSVAGVLCDNPDLRRYLAEVYGGF